jgi:hypothetical protein
VKENNLYMSERVLKRSAKLNVNKPAGGAKVAKGPPKASRPVGAAPLQGAGMNDKVSIAMAHPEAIEPQPLTPAQEIAAKQELIAPHEWAALLNTPESESDETYVGAPEALSELNAETDDLWERLSSTRWIKEPREDIHNHTTVVKRPASKQ